MDRGARPQYSGRRATAAALVSLLLAACTSGVQGGFTHAPLVTPGASVAAPTTATPTTAPPASTAELLPIPDGAADHGVLLENADGRFDRYRSIGRLRASSACTATLIDTGSA